MLITSLFTSNVSHIVRAKCYTYEYAANIKATFIYSCFKILNHFQQRLIHCNQSFHFQTVLSLTFFLSAEYNGRTEKYHHIQCVITIASSFFNIFDELKTNQNSFKTALFVEMSVPK